MAVDQDDAMRLLSRTGAKSLAVVDETGRVVGSLDLPLVVGSMAEHDPAAAPQNDQRVPLLS